MLLKKSTTNLFLIIVLSLFVSTSSVAKIVTYFAPATNLEKIDIQWLKKAKGHSEMYVAMYSFTDKPLAEELISLAKSGVTVYIYRDDKQMHDKNDVTHLFKGISNIHIKAKNDAGFWNIMHNKMFIIPHVVYREGSANWSASGEGASCWHGNCGPTENQDNNATFITKKKAIHQATQMFWGMWRRKNNIDVQN